MAGKKKVKAERPDAGSLADLHNRVSKLKMQLGLLKRELEEMGEELKKHGNR